MQETLPLLRAELIAHCSSVAAPACIIVIFSPAHDCAALPAASTPARRCTTSAPRDTVGFLNRRASPTAWCLEERLPAHRGTPRDALTAHAATWAYGAAFMEFLLSRC
jgi:hypothetical protein